MNRHMLIREIRAAVEPIKSGGAGFLAIDDGDTTANGKNQFLFFLKPELTDHNEKLDRIMEYIFERMDDFGMIIESVVRLSGAYLAKYGIIAEHYGIIDASASDPAATITPSMWEAFESEFGVGREKVKVVGGIPYLASHPSLDPAELSRQWLSRGYFRLGSGTYCQYVAEEDVYLVNGFYPKLLNHFTREESCIVGFVLRSSIDWSVARGDFVGVTAPVEAKPGSLRNGLLQRQSELGLSDISPNLNGVHLSAGPVEALVELLRFTENRESASSGPELTRFSFGQSLSERYGKDTIEKILDNSDVELADGSSTVFDATEELNASAALEVLATVYGETTPES